MEGKRTKLKKILIPIIAVVLVVTITATFLIVKNNKSTDGTSKKDNGANNVSTSIEKVEQEIQNSLSEQTYSVDYNGNYKFSYVHSVKFNPNLTEEQKTSIYKTIGSTSDFNGFLNYIYRTKRKDARFETISIINGLFSQSDRYYGMKQKGYFYGTNNRSFLYIQDKIDTVILRADGKEYLYEISITGFGLNVTDSTEETKLYITEHHFSTKSPDTELYAVTYVYDKIITEQQNPVSNSDIV